MSRPERFYFFSLYHPDTIILCAVTINLNLCWDLLKDRRSRRGQSSNTETESKASSSEFEISGDRKESGPSTRYQS
jgi:hypothetical protein